MPLPFASFADGGPSGLGRDVLSGFDLDASKFRPEHFLDENEDDPGRYVYGRGRIAAAFSSRSFAQQSLLGGYVRAGMSWTPPSGWRSFLYLIPFALTRRDHWEWVWSRRGPGVRADLHDMQCLNHSPA